MDPQASGRSPSLITTSLIIVSVVFPIISAFSIALRILAHRRSKQPLPSDGYWIIISWFFTLGLSILIWVHAGKSGVNYYNVDTMTGTELSLELIYVSSVYVQFPLGSVKIAVLLFYKRIFTTPLFRTIVWCAIGLISTWAIVFFVLVLIQIDPVAFPLMKVSLRFDDAAFGLAQVATSFTLDLLVLCLPLPVIFRLNMKRQRKWAVAMIFWLGSFCAVAAIVRTVLLNESIREVLTSSAYARVSNQSKQYIFMVIEPNCSILAASLPTYGPLLHGSRSLESIMKSMRSIFSLRSYQSNRSGGSRSHLPKNSAATDSQVELTGIKKWPGQGQQRVVVSHVDSPYATRQQLQKGISVENGVSVQIE